MLLANLFNDSINRAAHEETVAAKIEYCFGFDFRF